MTDPKASQRSKRAYLKRKHIAQAELAGATILDLTIAVRTLEGHYVIRLHDGTDIHLEARQPVEPEPAKPKKVYVPKSWEPSEWNRLVMQIRDQGLTKDDVRRSLDNAKKATPKQVEHFRAVLDAMPDTPDWYVALPLGKES